MFAFRREDRGENGIWIFLSGVVDGGLDFELMVGNRPAKLVIDTGKVTHMNSGALIPWLKYLERVRSEGTEVRFVECSPSIIGYANIVSSFARRHEIVSVRAPFFCTKCRREASELIALESEPFVREQPVSRICPSCKTRMEFDDDPVSYFAFLSR